jgi:predicted metalloprotease
MQFDDDRVDVGGVDDRRGRGGAIAMGGGGLGVVGLIIYLVVSALGGGGGVDLSGVGAPPAAQGSGGGESRSDLEQRCNTSGAIDRYDDCYMIKVYNEVNEVWTAELARRGESYEKPGLGFYEQAVQTGCGTASSQVGPFYCPPDREIYIDLGFLDQLQQQFGAQGRYAQAYILAHEAGHHLQTLLGTEPKVRRAQQADPSRANELSVSLELQADCYAGVYGRLANDQGNQTITSKELDQALGAAAAVGDDRIQQQTQGRVDPETFTHGTSAQRRQWFQTGYGTGDLTACDTFSG